VRSWKNAAANLRDFWLSTAGHGDATYLVYDDERWTYAESHEQVSRIARWLTDNGVKPGDRVAIAMRNYPEWLLSYWAIVSIGAVAVGVNAWWVPEELAYGFNDSAPVILICDRERLQRYNEIRNTCPTMTVVGVRCDDVLQRTMFPGRWFCNRRPICPMSKSIRIPMPASFTPPEQRDDPREPN
jgi:long-chain acyl-CoA synthetase